MFRNKQLYKQVENTTFSFVSLARFTLVLEPELRAVCPPCDDAMAGKSKMPPYRHLYSLMKTDLAITDI